MYNSFNTIDQVLAEISELLGFAFDENFVDYLSNG